jgi:antitoxin component YwqK of YwqJK toxin-antitoxin module
MIHPSSQPSTMLKDLLLTVGLFLLFCGTSLAQPTSQSGPQWPEGEAGVDYNLLDSDGKKQGVWIRVWPNGSLYYSGSFQAGVPEGVFLHYYESGEIMSEIINTDNGNKSQAKHFREDGSLQAEGIYVRTKKLNAEFEPIRQKLGAWKFYDKTGQLRLMENYSNGKLHGATQTTGTNGLIIESGSYSNGERDGVWKTFSETGSLLSEIGYSEGLFDGLCRANYPTGMPRSIGMYKGGVENGFWKTFLENGKVETTRQFEDGQLIQEIPENGHVLLLFPDERPKEEFTVEDTLKEGAFTEWHDNGEWTMVEEVDELSGDTYVRRVIKGQQIRKEGEYKDGLLDGEVFHFDMNGRLHKTERFEAGVLVETDEQ